jgi:hypothetical protein
MEKDEKLLREKFLPVDYRQDAFLEYHNLSQRTSTVEELIAEFDRLRMRCGAEEPEEQIIERFFGALRPEISDMVQLQPYWNFNDVCRLSLKVEKQLKAKSKGAPSRLGPIKADVVSTPVVSSPGNKPVPAKTEVSSVPGSSSTASSRLTRCFKCQGLGHFARDCPNKHLVTLTEETVPEYDTDEDEREPEPVTEILYPNRGEALITQRVLSTSNLPTGVGSVTTSSAQSVHPKGRFAPLLLTGEVVTTW